MGLTLAEKILKAHVVDGEFIKGKEIGIKIDQTLTQDATGTMAYLELEAMGVKKVATELSVSYVDHNMMQNGPEKPLAILSIFVIIKSFKDKNLKMRVVK